MSPPDLQSAPASRSFLSVIVPTFNRADFLHRALRSLLHQSLDATDYEIIVVDNNSTDDTARVVKRMTGEHAAIRYIVEPEQGVSHAKNAGLEAARGSIVAYLDDDVQATTHWLRTIADSFEHVRPTPHVVGGPAVPLFVGHKPTWYRDSYESKSWGNRARFLDRSECFYGLNVAFSRELLLNVGGFDPRLGMKGACLAFEEDCEVFDRLWQSTDGHLRAYYAPEALVMHLIPDARANPLYRVKRGFASGQAEYTRNTVVSGRSAFGCWLRGAYAFPRTVVQAVAGWRGLSGYRNWVIESGVPVAVRLGYLAAASSLRANHLRRSH